MSKQATTAMCLIALVGASALYASDDELMCVDAPVLSVEVETFVAAGDVVLLATADAVRRAVLLQSLRREPLRSEAPTPGQVRYSIADNMTAAMRYDHAFFFEKASNDDLRTNRFTSFSTARERDVLGLGMDWGVGDNNVVGFGYQLQSVRPNRGSDAGGGGATSILPGSEGLDHAFTLGVTRSWGGDD
jgi:hypothetical protein